MEDNIALIKRNVPLLELVKQETQANFVETGNTAKCKCFFHDDSDPSFAIDLLANRFNCFGCGVNGDPIDFIKLLKKQSTHDAISYLKDRFNIASTALNKSSKKVPAKKELLSPITPIPAHALDSFVTYVKQAFYQENFGLYVKHWVYKDASGFPWAVTCRFERDGRKDIIPFQYTAKGWRPRMYRATKRLLYNLDVLNSFSGLPVLIVEGEKCAEVIVAGFVVVTWIGAGNSITKTDWSALAGGSVYIWPDNDPWSGKSQKIRVGYQNALKILEILESIANVTVLKAAGSCQKVKGYDLFDYVEAGLDPGNYIDAAKKLSKDELKSLAEKPSSERKEKAKKGKLISDYYFYFLGWDDQSHYFLPAGARSTFQIGRGSFSYSKILELAPFNFWQKNFPTPQSKKKNIFFEQAVSYLIESSQREGMYDFENIRGSGVWQDSSDLVLNTGKDLVVHNEGHKRYDDYKSPSGYRYVLSGALFKKVEEISTPEAGHKLLLALDHCNFLSKFDKIMCLGWALMAPFGGVLKWRPHIWLTGPTKSGKTWLLDNIIRPLAGDFGINPSGRTTEAGLRRALGTDAMYVTVDEAEPNNRGARKRINAVLDLVRNSSSDSSSLVLLGNQVGGLDKFRIRSMFCLASIVSDITGNALESRFERVNLVTYSKTETQERRGKLAKLLADLPAFSYFRGRMFKKLPDIISLIDYFVDLISDVVGDRRKGDMWGPLLSSVWYLTHDNFVSGSKESNDFIDSFLRLIEIQDAVEKDEDLLLQRIFSIILRDDNGNEFNVAELLLDCDKEATIDYPERHSQNLVLKRAGFRLKKFANWEREGGVVSDLLFIAKDHPTIAKNLINTPYVRYYELLKRHPATVINRVITYRIITTTTCLVLDWGKIKEKYFNKKQLIKSF